GTKQEGLTTYSSQATFNVTTASNAVTLDVTIKNLSKGTLTLDTPYATTITGKTSYYSFTPVENGTYKFYSTGDANTCCTLLNYNLNFLTYNDDGDDMNFLLTYNCEAGKTYYLNVRLLDSSSTNSMDVTLHVEKETEDLE
ncbi:MAG: hypothetical protein J5988_01410, partial [Eubacterium sp.]|nr:hypothetical protein [Eubacterium sp.]